MTRRVAPRHPCTVCGRVIRSPAPRCQACINVGAGEELGWHGTWVVRGGIKVPVEPAGPA